MTIRRFDYCSPVPEPYRDGTVRDRIVRTLRHKRDWITGYELFEAIQPCASEASMRVHIHEMRKSGWDIESDWSGPGALGYRLIEARRVA
jgi:hypothetical protein